jgi:hypothetical protein
MQLLKDFRGFDIPIDSIIYGNLPNEKEKHFFNFGLCQKGTSFEMIACTYGYVHDVKQETLLNFQLIGSLEEHIDLLNCD